MRRRINTGLGAFGKQCEVITGFIPRKKTIQAERSPGADVQGRNLEKACRN